MVNSAMFAVSVLFAVSGNHALVTHGWGGYPPALRIADGVFGAATLVGIWWRKRWPVGFAVFVTLVGMFSTVASGVILVAVFTVAVHRRWPIAAAVTVLGALETIPFVLIYPQGDDTSTLIAATLLTLACTGWGMFVRARRQLVASLRERAERAEAEVTWRSEQARQGERERMAREMHDVLAHRLSLLSVHAGALEFRPDASAEEIARAAGVIRANAHEALEDLRSVIGVLRSGDEGAVPERPQATLCDLPALVDESRQAGAVVGLEMSGDLQGVPPVVGRSLYRIAQEGLTNARKHAASSPVWIELEGCRGLGVTIAVRTKLPLGASVGEAHAAAGSAFGDATGPIRRIVHHGIGETEGAVPGSGPGLIGLRERTALAGGWLECGPTDGGEFRLRAWMAWPA
jgi:signal transduction histidine kinase